MIASHADSLAENAATGSFSTRAVIAVRWLVFSMSLVGVVLGSVQGSAQELDDVRIHTTDLGSGIHMLTGSVRESGIRDHQRPMKLAA